VQLGQDIFSKSSEDILARVARPVHTQNTTALNKLTDCPKDDAVYCCFFTNGTNEQNRLRNGLIKDLLAAS
jgi:hypothetical protein